MIKQQMNTVPGMARQMIGVAAGIGRKALLDPSQKDAQDTISALKITIEAYEALIMLSPGNGTVTYRVNQLESAEQEDYHSTKHALRTLRALHGETQVWRG
jgi:hypothetical protein